MKNFLAITLHLLAFHLSGKLPAPLHKWRISNKTFRGKLVKMKKWTWIARASEADENGLYALHTLCTSNGLWDAKKQTYLGVSGRPMNYPQIY